MRYVHTENPDIIICLDTGTVIPRGNYLWPDDDSVIEPAPAPTFADYVARFTPGLQAWMETVARGNAYDSVLSCVSYKGSGVAQFAQDATAMIAWRDALWRWASQWQAGFNGQLPNPVPTLEQVISLAPQPSSFGWVVHEPGTIIESQVPVEQTS
ncbi:hypothetical protein BJI69_14410 [Luteibacter rhizovicinus DSM 16549]|uniref:Uncharacterized protein n=1 Tax=Luteibacter rhizovicinus DSM 16549 TaxID=1440763 RepID=A0A0G9HGX7_9GAMM|nr:hypothetical protein [Luteibacter rhizovicinus]APG04968.1 hypothetical protein BJI69_14410 [Luteibacter rhizovicinus DSM 16549]KLD68439.1 hypothetical protein Y883_01745 [Luteibacter rhizovicinus DSM 16549]